MSRKNNSFPSLFIRRRQNSSSLFLLIVAFLLLCWSFIILFSIWYCVFSFHLAHFTEMHVFHLIVVVFFSSEMCDRLTTAFIGIDYGFGQLNYYLFSMEIQRILPTILMNCQEPVALKFFGNISCNRMTFKGVCCTE